MKILLNSIFPQLSTELIISFALTGISLLLLLRIVSNNRKERDYRKQKDASQEEALRALEEHIKIVTEIRQREMEDAVNNFRNTQKDNYTDGYITITLPDNLRGIFTDLLRGFEDYAKLKGYNIAFSVDNSVPNEMAFKFTLQEESNNISHIQVRSDIHEYIDKVKSGQSFDDMPMALNPHEHSLITTTIKNRLSYLEHSYNLEKNSREHFENMFKQLSDGKGIFNQPPSTVVVTGGTYIPSSINANHSKGIVQGEQIDYVDSSDNSEHNNITISNSFNKRKEQVGKIDEIITLLHASNDIAADTRQKLITNFDKIKEEIADEHEPDKKNIYKWLTTIKKVGETAVYSHELTQAVNWLYESLNFLAKSV